ncbi:MAG TPA: zf-HC2 domain-containing protein [Gaiellaceae bacterium]|jgi:anti-sigma factor RsiW
MGRWWKTNACERASQWISLDLDGELSQLEQTALARHLTTCARCRELAVDVSSFTELLRAAPLSELERPIVVEVPRAARRRVARRAAISVAFAGLTAAAVLGGFVIPGSRPSSSALAFASVQQQKRFAHAEAQRLEPAVFEVRQPTVQSFAPRVLV